jgi:SAM-dependent methyltransferase
LLLADAATPSADFLHQQAAWLAPIRSRLLRRVAIARRQRVLDLGAGSGAVTEELTRRCNGQVIALDHALAPLLTDDRPFTGAQRTCAHAAHLPYPNAMFDLVFCQCALLWMSPLPAIIAEIWRVLQPGGVLVALEPDYGGLIEHPPTIATRTIWLAALKRAGADPLIGRKLPDLLTTQHFDVRADLLPELVPPSPARFACLCGLPLTRSEQRHLRRVEHRAAGLQAPWSQVAHLPFVLVTATKQ